MSDLTARIRDLKERIDGLTAELAETDPATSNLGAPGVSDPSAAGSLHGLADILFEDVRRTRERRWELRLELEAAEKELAGQVAAAPTAPDISLEYPEISVPGSTGGSAIESPFGEPDPPPPPRSPAPRTDQLLPPDPKFFGKRPGREASVPAASAQTPASSGPGVMPIAAVAVISLVLAVGAWQVFASSPPSPVAIAATAVPVPTTTSRPAVTAVNVAPPAATSAAAATIRVTGQPAIYSGACNSYTVTFVWIIEGTQTGNFMMRTGKGDTFGPESGPFLLSGSGGNLTWEPSTGRLTIRGASDSGASPGFRSQITKVNGRDVAGDATSIAAPGYCS